jgi:hypothetical protein
MTRVSVVAAPGASGQDGRVPVSEALRRLSEDPGFWTGDRVADTDDDRELRVTFPVTGGYALMFEMDLVSGERSVGLRTPASSAAVQLGWSPADGPYPASLRWWELDLFARVIALDDPTVPHPGLVVALLAPFAPATAEDDETAIAAMREAAYRSLRRAVPEHDPEPFGPQQAPLPLFASDDWWPAPPPVSSQVLDEAAIAALTLPARARLEVRAAPRFPREEIADCVRRSTALLHRLPAQPLYAATRPLARHIADTGDLRTVRDLLGALTEAGCDHPTVLDALSEPLVPAEACWVVETLAGAEPGTLLRRHV